MTLRSIHLMTLVGVLAVNAHLFAADEKGAVDADVAKVQSYDNVWESQWVAHLREIHKRAKNKTDGFVVHFGDSITYQNQYGSFSRSYKGDTEIGKALQWSKGGGSDWGDCPPDCKNGWLLARYDHPAGGRSFTAISGITTEQWLRGGKNFASGKDDKAPLDTILNNTTTGPHPDSKEGYKVAVVNDAQICMLMLGTNDVGGGRSAAKIRANLKEMIEKIEAKDIMVIISTIPPIRGKEDKVIEVNKEIRSLAREMKIPLNDYWAEIMRRRPGDTWQGKLISHDGVHPNGGKYEDPFKNPEVLSNNGALLQGFLVTCKIAEVKKYVIDGKTPPASTGNAGNNGADVAIQTDGLPDAKVGEAYTITLEATGGTKPYKWSALNLPHGLKLSSNGILKGTPTRAKSTKVKLKVIDKKGRVTRKTLELIVEK